MDLFSATFTAVATLLGIGLLGFWLLSRRILFEQVLGPLSVLSLDIALPCLIFSNIVFKFSPDESPRWWLMPVWYVGFTLFLGLITAAAAPLARREFRREFRFSLFFQNAVFFPLAILVELFGAASHHLVDLFLFTLLYPAVFFNSAHLFFGSRGQGIRWSRTLNPVLVATILALAVRLAGLHTWIPGFGVSALNMVGGMSVPLLMLVLGGSIFIDFQGRGRIQILEVLKFILIKNLFVPLAVLGMILLIKPPPNVALILMLQAASPPLSAVPVLTEREGGNRAIANQYLVGSFLFSLATLPVMVVLFGKLAGE